MARFQQYYTMCEPKPPSKTITKHHLVTSVELYSEQSMCDLENIKADCVSISYNDHRDFGTLIFYRKEVVPNSKYQKEYKKYENDLKKYQEWLEYRKELDAKQKQKSLKERRKLYEELKKEFQGEATRKAKAASKNSD